MNAKLPNIDEVEFNQLIDEAWAPDEDVLAGLLFEFEDFVLEVFGGESGVGPGDTFYGAGKSTLEMFSMALAKLSMC